MKHVIRAGVEVCLHAVADRRRVAPDDERVEEAGAAAVLEIGVVEFKLVVVQVVREPMK